MRVSSCVFFAPAIALVSCTPAPTPPTTPPLEMNSAVDVDDEDEVTALICPGAVGCASAEGTLRAGAAFRAITPSLDAAVYLAGFSLGRAATGVHDDVEARVFVVEQGDVRTGFVTVDTVGWFQQDAQRIRRRVRERGVELDHIVVSSTHNHESKDTMGIWGASVSETGYDDAYQDFVADQAADAFADAVDALHLVVLTTSQGDASRLVNDTRLPLVGDPHITLFQFDAVDDAQSDITWVVWGNHPETLGSENTLISADYPGALRKEVEALLPGTTCIFSNGVLGGLTTTIGLTICPNADGVDTCPQGTFERAEAVGQQAARIAVDALLANAARPATPTLAQATTTLAFRRLPIRVTPSNSTLIFAFGLGLLPRTVYDTGGGKVPDEDVPFIAVADMQAGYYQMSSEVDAITLGDAEIVTVPGELYGELWVTGEHGESLIDAVFGGDYVVEGEGPVETPIQQSMPVSSTTKKVILNQTNDSIGYIIPRTQWDGDAPYCYGTEGGQYGEQNSAGPGAAFEVTDGVRRLYEEKLR